MSSITIQSNLASLRAQRRLGTATSSLQRSFERLSSGLRIVHASDDAAGLAVASELGLNSRVFTQGIRNANDAISVLNIAEGATSQLSNVVVRLKELAESAANGTLSLSQRKSLDSEANQLVKEYNRLVATTSFNGLNLLDATFGSQAVQLGYTSRYGINITTGGELDRGVGTGAFGTTGAASGAIGNGTSTASGDFNGDGKLDIVVGDFGAGSARVYLGNGSGGFSAGSTITTGGSAATVQAADFNNDGKLDIVSMTATGSVRVNIGNGSGGFTLLSTTATSADQTFELADINNDGRVDFIGQIGVSGYDVRLGTATGFAASQTLSGSPAAGMALGDINGDGNLDLLSAETSSSRIRAFLNDGNGRFGAGTVLITATNVQGISVADFNHDGYDDVVYNTTGTNVALNRGNGTFSTATALNASADMSRIGDINGDGLPDIVSGVVGVNLTTYLGNEDGSFGSGSTTIITDNLYDAFSLGDYTGDGAADVMYADISIFNQLYFYRGNSTQVSSIGRLDLLDTRSARSALDTTTQILDRITKELGAIGAAQSRLETATKVLRQQVEGSENARSVIQDVDVADEAAHLVKTQIIQKAAASILTQANIQPNIALQLLNR